MKVGISRMTRGSSSNVMMFVFDNADTNDQGVDVAFAKNEDDERLLRARVIWMVGIIDDDDDAPVR